MRDFRQPMWGTHDEIAVHIAVLEKRVEALEAALRQIAERSWHPANAPMGDIARAALAPEQDK